MHAVRLLRGRLEIRISKSHVTDATRLLSRLFVASPLFKSATMVYIPQKPLSNATNICPGFGGCFPTPPQDAGCKRRISQRDETPTKRLRIMDQAADESEEDGDIDMGLFDVANCKTRRYTMFNRLKATSFRSPFVAAPNIRTQFSFTRAFF